MATMKNGIWSEDEHDRFLLAIREYPKGPWSTIADRVGTRSVRQVQTHTQKYYEKIMRRMRGLRKDRKTWARLEHRIDDDILEFCKIMNGSGIKIEALPTAPSNNNNQTLPLRPPIHPTADDNNQYMDGPQAYNISLEDFNSCSSTSSSWSTGMSSSGDDDEIQENQHPITGNQQFSVSPTLPSLEESLDFLIASMEASTKDHAN